MVFQMDERHRKGLKQKGSINTLHAEYYTTRSSNEASYAHENVRLEILKKRTFCYWRYISAEKCSAGVVEQKEAGRNIFLDKYICFLRGTIQSYISNVNKFSAEHLYFLRGEIKPKMLETNFL